VHSSCTRGILGSAPYLSIYSHSLTRVASHPVVVHKPAWVRPRAPGVLDLDVAQVPLALLAGGNHTHNHLREGNHRGIHISSADRQ
jgi:hypothetical protein